MVGRPVVVRDYPKEIKAFYMRLNEDDRTVAAMDVLAPGIGEIIGGSQREERLDVLDRRIADFGLEVDDYWWYRDLRKYGPPTLASASASSAPSVRHRGRERRDVSYPWAAARRIRRPRLVTSATSAVVFGQHHQAVIGL